MNYKETSLSGSQYQRCYNVDIQNQLNQPPRITFNEELVTVLNDQTLQQCVGALHTAFDPIREITLLDPTDGTPLGSTMTHGQLYTALWSLYTELAVARDGILQPEPIEP